MSSLSDLIDFLVGLMRDDDANAAFEENPQATLAGNGLGHVTGQDVRDARMIMRDGGGLHPTGHGGHSGGSHRGGHDDPVREIHHTTANYRVDEHYQYVDQTFNLVKIDDRDTIVVDSFNSNDNNDIDVVAIQDNSREIEIEDSFNDAPPAPAQAPAEPEPESEPVASIDPVEDEPVGVEEDPVEEEPVAPVEDTVPVHEEPDLDPEPLDAAVI